MIFTMVAFWDSEIDDYINIFINIHLNFNYLDWNVDIHTAQKRGLFDADNFRFCHEIGV